VVWWSADTRFRVGAWTLPINHFCRSQNLLLSTLCGPSLRKPRAGLTSWLAPGYSEAVARLQEFDEACRRCAKEIAAGQFDLLFANSAVDYNVPFVLRHLRMKKVLYLQEPRRFLYEAAPILPWVSSAADDLGSFLFNPRTILRNYPNLQTLRLQAKQEWLNVHACDRVLVNSYF
jgi:hypothetical protein